MKKFLVVLVVLAMVVFSSMAFAAAEISVGGSLEIRGRNFKDLDFNKDAPDGTVDTQSRVKLDVNAKAGDDVKGKISIWNDYDTWGRLEQVQADGESAGSSFPASGQNAGFLTLREAWISFNVPGIPVNVTGGHQLLMLGQGFFFRSMHYGSDAWVVANVTGPNTAAFVNVKASEGSAAKANDDVDAYVLLDVFKINEAMVAGIDITNVKVRPGVAVAVPLDGFPDVRGTDLINIGLNFTGKLGPVNLKAEADVQTGKLKTGGATEPKFKGQQLVVKGSVPMDPLTINFLLGYGSGQKSTDTDVKAFVPILDVDPHYTFLYEYKTKTACGAKNTGFCNTTAVSAGVMFAATKSLSLGADVYYLKATEKVPDVTTADPNDTTDEIGTEVDVTINWKLYDNLSLNTSIGYLDAGKGLGKDPATGIQSALAFKF
jgi:hypothetical protein